MPYSYEVEQQLLAGLLNYPDKYIEVSPFIAVSDFVADTNAIIFSFLKADYDQGNYIDDVILAERIKLSGISFEENINIGDYIKALKLRKSSPESIIECAQELKRLSVRRGISSTGKKLSRAMDTLDGSKTLTEIIDVADSIYNETIDYYENGDNHPCDIFEEMEEMVELQGNNPQSEFGPRGPHNRLQELLGSHLWPCNLTKFVARPGFGNTTFGRDY